ncbi:MAG: hypothetical protein V1800_17340 [Candidatus Latescibacterota bacterium]
MLIPNADRAFVDLEKLRGYCLNESHSRGKHKARLFSSILGLTSVHAEQLRKTLLDIVRTHHAAASHQDEYGKQYVVDFMMKSLKGRAKVRSLWIIRSGEDFPRLTTCYVLRKGGIDHEPFHQVT